MNDQLVVRLLRAIVMFSVVGFATPSLGAKKNEKVTLDVKERKRVKKNLPAAQTRITRNEAFLIAIETKLKGEIVKAIAYLKKTAARMPKKSTARLEMRERLVNLRLELAILEANEENRRYDRAWSRWDAGGRRGAEPKLNSSNSRRQWQTLANDAQVLLREFPRSKNADVTTFNMGLAKNFLGREKDAARIFSQLIAKYPNSQKAGDAYFALGDFYFDRADFRNAMNNYTNALRFKRAKAYAWSLFKLGWCNYNLGNYKTSLRRWKETVNAAQRVGKRGLALKEEALRDMVYAFAELRQVEPAISYYRRNGGQKYIGRFLNLLANTFADQGQYSASIKVWKRFQQVAPYDEAAPDSQKEIIALYYELGKLPQVWAELARFPKLYGPGSRWAARHKSDRKLFLEVQQTIKDQILYYAKLTHKNAQKDDNRRGYAEALKGYNLYLKSYPRSREVAEVKYNMADIEFFSKRYRNAGRLYLEICLLGKAKAVIYEGNAKKSRNIHKQSAEWMLDAYNRDFEPEFAVLIKRKPNFSKPPRPISPRAKNFVKACGYYQKWYPGDKKNIKTCDVFISEIFYRSNDKKMSKKYLWMLAKKYPGSKEGNDAVENLVPLYKGDKLGLEKAVKEILKIPAYAKGKQGAKLRALLEGLEAENIAKIKDRGKRAARYEALYKKNPRRAEADKLIYNAAVDYLSAGMISKAIVAYMIVLKKHPRSAGAQESLLQVAKLNERRLEYATAAGFYLQYQAKYPKDKFALGSLAKACELQAAIEASKAVATCLQFARRDAQGAKLIFQRMVSAAYSARSLSRLSQLVRTYVSKFQVSSDERVIAYSYVYFANRGKGGAASQAASQILAGYRRGGLSGEALRAVGELTFKRVNGELSRFQKIALRGGSVDNLLKSIQAKVQALQKLQSAYDQVIATKDSYWGVAALYQSGYARELLAQALEKPPQITGAKYADVIKQLSGDAKSARMEARKYYDLALKSVPKFMVYNEWAARARTGIARNTGQTVSFDDIIVTPDFLGAEVPTTVVSAVR